MMLDDVYYSMLISKQMINGEEIKLCTDSKQVI